MSLVEAQIDPSLIPKKDSLYTEMFQNYAAISILSNDAKKLIGRRKQGGVMTS